MNRVIEVFADVGCPFTHVGLRRFVEARAERDRPDVRLRVKAWPLEIVNGTPLDPALIADEVDEVRSLVAPELFAGFDPRTFPATLLPAMALAAAAYDGDLERGEAVSLELRDLLFERSTDIASEEVLRGVADLFGVTFDPGDTSAVHAEHIEGVQRSVTGSPHFFTPEGGFFCPALDVSRDAGGHLRVDTDPDGFERFLSACFA